MAADQALELIDRGAGLGLDAELAPASTGMDSAAGEACDRSRSGWNGAFARAHAGAAARRER